MKKLAFLFLLAVALAFSGALSPAGSEEATYEIKAAKDGWTPAEITVKQGQRVTLKFVSVDVDHGIDMKEFGLKNVVIPEKDSVTQEFTPQKSGTFTFPCTKYCSWRHLVGMRPYLTVKVVQ